MIVMRAEARRAARAGACLASALILAYSVPARAQVVQGRAEVQFNFPGETTNDNYGWSVADTGDVNGDGIHDFIVGAIYNDTAATDAGKAYVYLGGATPSTTPFVTMTGLATNDQFGVSVAGAGDVNGDGYADVIVGAPYNDRNGSAAGAAYVFYGGRAMDNTPDVIMVGEIHDDQFGWSVAGAGDVDGDGLSDVIVRARLDCVDKVLCVGNDYARGRAYVFRGGRPMDATADLVLNGDSANDWFGNTVAGIGDVNGDGLGDVAVGAIYASPVVNGMVLSAAGTTSVYFGGRPMDAVRHAQLPGEQANNQSGWAIASAGDADSDGRGDFWTTAHFYNDGVNTGEGKAYLFAGGPHIGPLPRATVVGDMKDGQLGQSIAGGDVAGAGGLTDGIVGEVYATVSGSRSGEAFILSPFCVGLSSDPTSFFWASCSPFVSYNLYRGSVRNDLPLDLYGTCAQSGLPGFSAPMDAVLPSLGDAFFYLITGRNPMLEGALGFDSSGALRPNTSPCP